MRRYGSSGYNRVGAEAVARFGIIFGKQLAELSQSTDFVGSFGTSFFQSSSTDLSVFVTSKIIGAFAVALAKSGFVTVIEVSDPMSGKVSTNSIGNIGRMELRIRI